MRGSAMYSRWMRNRFKRPSAPPTSSVTVVLAAPRATAASVGSAPIPGDDAVDREQPVAFADARPGGRAVGMGKQQHIAIRPPFDLHPDAALMAAGAASPAHVFLACEEIAVPVLCGKVFLERGRAEVLGDIARTEQRLSRISATASR